MKFILGKKIAMTQIWKEDQVYGATKVQVGPCLVSQVKTKDKDGYQAVQLGLGKRHPKNINKPQQGHFKDLENFKYLREFRVEDTKFKRGDKIDASSFVGGDIVKVTALSKGKGFQGVVKRHGFKGTKKSHGNKDQLRMPGSIGATGPAHVFKGTRMGGRMGGKQVTVTNLEIIEVDIKNNILLIKGAVPGARNSLVLIEGPGEMKVAVEKKEESSENSPATPAQDEKSRKNEEKSAEEKTGGKDKKDKKAHNK